MLRVMMMMMMMQGAAFHCLSLPFLDLSLPFRAVADDDAEGWRTIVGKTMTGSCQWAKAVREARHRLIESLAAHHIATSTS